MKMFENIIIFLCFGLSYYFIEVCMTYNVVLNSCIKQSDSVIDGWIGNSGSCSFPL